MKKKRNKKYDPKRVRNLTPEQIENKRKWGEFAIAYKFEKLANKIK